MPTDDIRALRTSVLMVSTSYPGDLSDWRGLFIRHLAEALARRRDLQLRLWSPPGEIPDAAQYVATPAERQWLATLMAKGGISHLLRTQRVRGLAAPVQLLAMLWRLYRREASVSLYHVNWLQNALPLPGDGRPLLVTVLGSDMQLLQVPGMTAGLRRAFGGRRVAICPNAEWMLPELRRRFGDIASIRCVPFGIEPRWFALQRQPVVPSRWLCVSRITQGKIGPLFKWCEPYFADGRRELHLLGPMQQDMTLPAWVHYHGATDPDALCRQWFPSAQGLITLSRHAEGRPQVMLEAMAAGLPIIASEIPAHADLLRHRETGWLCANPGDVGDALDMLGAETPNLDMGRRAKAWVHTEIGTWDDCAQRYANIYADLLGSDR
jgi:hypothetical protein